MAELFSSTPYAALTARERIWAAIREMKTVTVREVADLMADVVALDVDGVDILLGEAVLALPLCQQALGLGLLVAHAPCIEDLVLGKEHEGA